MYLYIKFAVLFVYFLYFSSFSSPDRWLVSAGCFGNCGSSTSGSDSKKDPAYTAANDNSNSGTDDLDNRKISDSSTLGSFHSSGRDAINASKSSRNSKPATTEKNQTQ